MKPKKPASPAKIVPPAEWRVDSAYGSLQTRTGMLLVRLEDVHAEMCRAGVPPHDATYKLFGPFYEESIALSDGHPYEVSELYQLHIASALERPDLLWRNGVLSKSGGAKLYAQLPDLEHWRFPADTPGATLYALGEAALRLWHGGADVSTDHVAMWKEKADRQSDRRYDIHWPSDDALRKLLGRLAVPHELAHKLWNWGSVAQVVQLHAAPTVVAPPATYLELVAFRKNKPQSEWTTPQKNIAATEAKKRKDVPGAKGVASAMANELGISVSRFNDLIRNPSIAGKRETARSKSA